MCAALAGMAGGVVSDQADADDDMSIKQRLLTEGGGVMGDLTGVDIAADALSNLVRVWHL